MVSSILDTLHALPMPSVRHSEFATKFTYQSIVLSDLKFENQTNETIVSCNSNIYGRLILNIQPKGVYNKLRQVLVGIKDEGPQQFVLSERKIIGKRLEGFMGVDVHNKVIETHTDIARNFILKAPSCPGVYEVEVLFLELEGEAIEQAGTVNGFFQLNEGDRNQLSSETALETTWKMDEQGCRVSLGRIRVI